MEFRASVSIASANQALTFPLHVGRLFGGGAYSSKYVTFSLTQFLPLQEVKRNTKCKMSVFAMQHKLSKKDKYTDTLCLFFNLVRSFSRSKTEST